MERSKNSRSRSVPGSHPHAGRNPTENECGGIHRISQREKQFDDFSTTRESEVQIWESIILVQRVLYVDTAGKNAKKIAEYIQNQLKEDQLTDQMTLKEYMDPLAGNK